MVFGLHDPKNIKMADWWDSAWKIAGIGGGLITWFLNQRANRVAARRRHTFDALHKISLDPFYQKHLSAVRPYIYEPGNSAFPDLELHENKELKESVRFLLNYYEFIAAALWRGALSESLLIEDQGAIMPGLFRHAERWIISIRNKPGGDASLFRELEFACQRWNRKNVPLGQRFLEWVLERPIRFSIHGL